MMIQAPRGLVTFLLSAVVLPALVSTAGAESDTSLTALLAGSAVPHTLRLRELTSDWRRVSVAGEMMLGMGGMQSLMQGVGSMFGGGASDALYTRGATIKIGDQRFLVAYRLPAQGINFGALMAMGAGAAGGAAPKPPSELPKKAPITPDTQLSLTLVNLRAIASIGDIRPFDLAEATKAAPPGLLEGIFDQRKEKADAAKAASHLKQLATGLLMYSQDYNEVLPPMRDAASLKKALMPYVRDETVFKSPATDQPFLPNPRLSGRLLRTLKEPGGVVALYSAVPEPYGTRLIARADGSVRSVSADEWQQVARAQKLPAD